MGVRLPDGTFKSRITAEYPAQLAQALAFIIRPFLTTGNPVLHVADWPTILPKQLSWPDPPGRIEDGGGLPRTALHMIPQRNDKLASLRSRWFKRLSDSRQSLKITVVKNHLCQKVSSCPTLTTCLRYWTVHPATSSWTLQQANRFD